MSQKKCCPRCKEIQSADQFNMNRRNKDGLACYCRGCERAIYIARREAALNKKAETNRCLALSEKTVPSQKLCRGCKTILSSKQFTKFRYSKDGLSGLCKGCQKERRSKTYEQRKMVRAKHREANRDKINEQARRSYRKRVSEDPCVRVKYAISKAVRCGLKRTGSSKHGESTFKHLPYTVQELKKHIESQWEGWMNWGNYGPYENGRQTWQIDHIIPQSALPFTSFEDENFHKLWALENLRPLETVANMKKGAHHVSDS